MARMCGCSGQCHDLPYCPAMPQPDPEWDQWKAASDEERTGCWCAEYRKPCPYHEGWEDGYEAAQRSTTEQPLPDGEGVN